jgi:hypothetical protein
MSTVAVSAFPGGDDIVYVDPVMDAESTYPTDIGNVTFPEVWAPRIYAKGLSKLELASSGGVAVTASDMHALDITADAADGTAVRSGGPALTLGTSTADVLHAVTGDTGTTVNIVAASVEVDADSEVTLTAGGNPTVSVLSDRMVVRGDLDVEGSFNFSDTRTVETLAVTNNFIDLAGGLDHEQSAGVGSRTGVRIGTVPDAASAVPGGELDAYLRRYRDGQGVDAFHASDGSLDPEKYSKASSVFHKGLVYNVNGGTQVAGVKSRASRTNEPFWDLFGGAFRISRVVPGDGVQRASRLGIGLRVTDGGELEITQHRTWLDLVEGEYFDGDDEPVRFVSRFGQL